MWQRFNAAGIVGLEYLLIGQATHYLKAIREGKHDAHNNRGGGGAGDYIYTYTHSSAWLICNTQRDRILYLILGYDNVQTSVIHLAKGIFDNQRTRYCSHFKEVTLFLSNNFLPKH